MIQLQEEIEIGLGDGKDLYLELRIQQCIIWGYGACVQLIV